MAVDTIQAPTSAPKAGVRYVAHGGTAGYTEFEILSDETNRNDRHLTVRWTLRRAGDTDDTPVEATATGVEHAYRPVEPAPLAVLEDRYDSALIDEHDPSDIQEKLDDALGDLADAVLRREASNGRTIVDGRPVDLSSIMDLDGLQAMIRSWIIEHAAEHADWSPGR